MLDSLIAGARSGRAGALAVLGEAGAGKSSLLAEATADLYAVRVFRTQGVESEAPLAYAALHRLLRPLEGLLTKLPVPQARALGVAFGLEEGEVPEPFLVALGTLSVLTEAAEDYPVVCVVDDAHWLDDASADALRFVARRMDADRVAMLFGVREGDRRTFATEGIPTLRLTGLDPDAARALLMDVTDGALAPDVADQLVAATGGNPLALTELPGALTAQQLAGTALLEPRQLVADRVADAFLARFDALSVAGRTFVEVAATDDTGRLDVVQAAATAAGADLDGVDQAVSSGLLTVQADRVEMRHPMVRTAVYARMAPATRDRVHGVLADVLTGLGDVDRGTWHRAAQVTAATPEVADALDDVGRRAERRGAFIAAADAYERAVDLRPTDEKAPVRLYDAARNSWASGHTIRAQRLASRARTLTEQPLLRADIDRLRGRIEVNVGSAPDAHRIFVEAAAAVAPHDQIRALEMAVAASVAQGHGAGSGAVLAPRLVDTTPLAGDTARVACLKQLLDATRLYLADDLRPAIDRLRAAQDAGRSLTDLDVLGNLGNAALHVGDDAGHREFYTLMLSAARARGDAMSVLYALQRLAFSQLLSGRWDELRASSEEAVALSLSLGQRPLSTAPHAWLLLLAALQGREDYPARLQALEELVEGYPPPGMMATPVRVQTRWARAVHASAQADASQALHHFSRNELPVLGLMVTQDRVDAAVRAGDLDRAQTWTAAADEFADRSGWPWARAAAAFGRARIAEASGLPPNEVTLPYEEALSHHNVSGRPYDQARTQLAYGEYLRRVQRRVDARTQLRAALSTLEDLTAGPLMDRAAAELRATGETARKRDPSTLTQLTPTELKVAELVRQGLSNKEVAAQIWVSPRTVAFHLRNVFTKTGITSRGQLSQLDLT